MLESFASKSPNFSIWIEFFPNVAGVSFRFRKLLLLRAIWRMPVFIICRSKGERMKIIDLLATWLAVVTLTSASVGQTKCPVPDVDTTQPTVALNSVAPGDASISGKVTLKAGTTGTVVVCVNGVAQGNPAKVADKGEFTITLEDGLSLTGGQRVVAQFTAAGQKAGSPSDIMVVQNKLASLDKYYRGVVGIDLSATSAQATRTSAFLEFNITASPDKNHRFWLWLDPKIASVPQQASSILSTVTTSNPSFNSLLGTQLNQLVSSFDVSLGSDFDFRKSDNFDTSSAQDAKVVLAFTLGGGFQTPLTVTQTNVQEFTVPSTLSKSQLQQLFGPNIPAICSSTITSGCISTVAFQPPDRTHFYKQYWVGLRLKSYYYGEKSGWSNLCSGNGNDAAACPIYPGTVDLTVGQNEAVSGGNLHKFLLRSDVYYPLPFNPAFYAFFNAWIHLNRHHENPNLTPVILSPVASPPTDTSQIQYISVLTPDRDYYRVGMGIDLVSLIQHFHQDKNTTPAAATKP